MTDPYVLTAQNFDHNDPKNIGRPLYFNLDQYLSCVEQMISADEVEKAFWMLNNLPGWYRDHEPNAVTQLRKHLHKQLFTPIDYAKVNAAHVFQGYSDQEISDFVFSMPRALAVKNLVASLEQPHIVEYGPGSYFIPYGLRSSGLKFSYFGEGLNIADTHNAAVALQDVWSHRPNKANIFVCFEVIEHLHQPAEIYQYSLKHETGFDYICLSTPLYSWNGGNPQWHTSALGHLRTYTPAEFLAFAIKYWPNYEWRMEKGMEIYLEGKRHA